MVYM